VKKLVLAVVLVLSACARSGSDLPYISYGRDACARCGMILSEERFVSGYVDKDGQTIAFDDLGEFLAMVAKDPSIASKAYVHDAKDGRWLRAASAVFLKIPGLATPMGSGYAAFSAESEAWDFALRLGRRPAGPIVTL
jgi:copper chaperone NosL